MGRLVSSRPWNLRIPSTGHAYASQALNLCLEEIKAAGIADHTWVLAEPDAFAQIQAVLPNVNLAVGVGYTATPPSPASLVASGYQVVNSVFGLSNQMIQAYQNAGLWVNLWVVDETWQYSRLWLAGVNSVTSNNSQDMLALPFPILSMPYSTYLVVWGLLGLIAALTYWRTRRR
jgi:glycerophosphoinositol inositolphosphodiesterase